MSSRQIQIVVGLLIVFAVGIALVMIADNNREKLATRMEAEKAATQTASEAEAKKSAAKTEDEAAAKALQEGARPSFDVARFEPTGDGVIAGLAKPGALVELLADGEPIASTSANDVGEWVVVLETPLKPGSYDLSLRATSSGSEATSSEEFIAVVIPESSTGDVLVVASRPGQASEILARPQAAAKPDTDPGDTVRIAAADTTEVAATDTMQSAASDPGAAPADVTAIAEAELKQTTEPLENPPAETDTAETLPAEGAEGAVAETVNPTEPMDAEATPNVDVAEKQGAEGAANTVTANSSEANDSSGTADQVAETTETTARETVVAARPTGAEAAQETSQDVAAASGAPKADETSVAGSTKTEVDTSTASGAATGTVETVSPETSVATKMDAPEQDTQTASAADIMPETNGAADPSVAVAQPAEDTMTADKADKPAEPMQDKSGKSVEKDVAAAAPEAASGTPEAAEAPAEETQIAKAEDVVVPQPEKQPAVEKPRPVHPLALDAVETEGDMVYAAGTGNSGTTVRVYVDDTYIGETVTDDGGRWLLETPASIAAGNVIVRADELETGNADVVRRAEVPFLKQADAIALLPTSATGGGAGETSSAKAVVAPKSVIIRRGDNLWTISRRTYGRGIRYTTIYNANDDQIRNPHMIFPGQIFVLPEGDKSWTQ